MRIALIVNTFPKTSETFIYNKVAHLIQSGNEVRVFCSFLDYKLLNRIFPGNDALSVTVFSKKDLLQFYSMHPFRLAFLKRNNFSFSKALFNQYRVQRINSFFPDIVHFEFSSLAFDFIPYMKMIKGLKIVSCRGSAEKVKLLQYPGRKQIYQQLFSIVDGIHCVSEDMKNTVSAYCENISKIFVCYSGIDTNNFSNNPFPKDTFTIPLKILSIGRMKFSKGFANGLLVMRILKDQGLQFTWSIAGTDKNEEELVFKTHQLNLQGEVRLLGELTHDDVKREIANADIFYLPSVYEGIANVALESMSMGIPVVATKSGGMSEAIQHEYNGMLAPIYDFKEQADCILQIANNPALAQKLGVNSRKKIIEKFEIQKQMKELIAHYKTIMENKFK